MRAASRLAGMASSSAAAAPLIDIGCNLTDPMFRGVYRGKRYHADDFDAVLARGWAAGLAKIIVTAAAWETQRSPWLARGTRAALFHGRCASDALQPRVSGGAGKGRRRWR